MSDFPPTEAYAGSALPSPWKRSQRPTAHRNLGIFSGSLRPSQVPDLYYRYVRGEGIAREELLDAFPETAQAVHDVAWHATLSKMPMADVVGRVEKALGGARNWVLLGGPHGHTPSRGGLGPWPGLTLIPSQMCRDDHHQGKTLRTDPGSVEVHHAEKVRYRCTAFKVARHLAGLSSRQHQGYRSRSPTTAIGREPLFAK